MGTTGSASIHVSAQPDAVYALISDVTRMGEWSPETRSCEWLDGASGVRSEPRGSGHASNCCGL